MTAEQEREMEQRMFILINERGPVNATINCMDMLNEYGKQQWNEAIEKAASEAECYPPYNLTMSHILRKLKKP